MKNYLIGCSSQILEVAFLVLKITTQKNYQNKDFVYKVSYTTYSYYIVLTFIYCIVIISTLAANSLRGNRLPQPSAGFRARG